MTIILWYHESKPFSNLLFFISKMKTRVFKLLNFISEKNSKLKSKQIVNFIFEYFILMTWRSSPLSFFRGFLCHQYGNGLFNVPINGRPVGVVFSGENLNIVWGPLRGVMYVPSLNFKTWHFLYNLRRRPCDCWYFTIVFAFFSVTVAVLTHLCVVCHHFCCP